MPAGDSALRSAVSTRLLPCVFRHPAPPRGGPIMLRALTEHLRPRVHQSLRRTARRLQLEQLEDRTAPAVNVFDLTFDGATATVNNAIFRQVDPQPTGTGFIDPFVRIQRSPSNPSGMEQGYNTDGIEEFDTKDAGGHNWNHSLKLANLQEVNGYYQFTLDINETKPGTLLSLDELQIFVQSA